MIDRREYIEKLNSKKWNGLVKIITGIRRCGKSVLLFDLFYNCLLNEGVDPKNIIKIKLDERSDMRFRNPNTLCDYVRDFLKDRDTEKFYVFIDEVQLIEKVKVEGIEAKIGLYEVLNELNGYDNLDVYVTGSNLKVLSSDIQTEFRGRGDEIRVHPLSFKEFYVSFTGDKHNAWEIYSTFGGMPYLTALKSDEEKSEYLKKLLDKVYISDVIERNKVRKDSLVLGELLDILASSVGSLTSPTKLSNTFNSVSKEKISPGTLSHYLEYFADSFMVSKARRYDIKGKAYIDSPAKYYFEDIGLRNARLGFKERDVTHIMESVIYNEMILRGFNVDVGILEHYHRDSAGKVQRSYLEVDFVCNKGTQRYYIQSAYAIPDKTKQEQEIRGFLKIDDSFQKIVIMRENIIPYRDDKGILYIGVEKFLLDKETTK